MTWISDFIDKLPQLVGYIAPGFLLVVAFMWATSTSTKNGTILIVTATVSSYLIHGIIKNYDAMHPWLQIIVCFGSFFVGAVAAIIYKTERFNAILSNVGIKRTTNHSIWDDVIGAGAIITIFDSKEQKYYCGSFKYQKTEDGISYLVICKYYVADVQKKVLEDETNSEKLLMIQQKDLNVIMISKNDPFGNYNFLYTPMAKIKHRIKFISLLKKAK